MTFIEQSVIMEKFIYNVPSTYANLKLVIVTKADLYLKTKTEV